MEEEYIKLFSLIDDTLTKQKQQKKDGINDYNLLTTVLKYHDEVRLNSRMIGSLLDPEGSHYQENLFMDIFLDTLNLKGYFNNTKNVKVYIEYRDIDLFITDEEKHIIIENKVWAIDQPCQVMKYINIINQEYELKKDKNDILENLKVFYLTPRNKKSPDKHKLNKYENTHYISYPDQTALKECSEKMKQKNTIDFDLENLKANYTKISYKKEILRWLTKCQDSVIGLPIEIPIMQYIEVVEKINKTYKRKIVAIEDELMTKNKEGVLKYKDSLKSALILDDSMDKVKGALLLELFQNINNYFEKKGFESLNGTLNLDNRSFATYENNCDKWFDSSLKNNKRRIDIGTFIKYSETIAIFVIVGKYHLHIGIAHITEDDGYTIGNSTDGLPIIPEFIKRENWDLKSSTKRFDDFYEIMNYEKAYFYFNNDDIKEENRDIKEELDKLLNVLKDL